MSLLAAVSEVVLGSQTEIAIFLIALCMHTVLFGSYCVRPKSQKLRKEAGFKKSPKAALVSGSGPAEVASAPGADSLARLAKQLLRRGASRDAMVEEIGSQVRANHAGTVCLALACVLESAGKSVSAELVAATRAIMIEHGLAPTSRLSELLLKSLLALRLRGEFQDVLAETEAVDAVTPTIAVLALRSAVASSDLDTALGYLQRFAAPLKAVMDAAPSSEQLVQQLLQLSAQRGSVPELLRKLGGCGVVLEPHLVGLLQSLAGERRLADAAAVLRACPEKTARLYNILLDACVDGQDMEVAERVLAEAAAAGAADAATYSTIAKRHLELGHPQRALSALEKMRSAGGGLAPSPETFNELMGAAVQAGGEGVWVLLDEMRACGLQPTAVTCSILLKSVQRSSGAADVERAVALAGELTGSMDEVLLSSVCEACIRAGRTDLLGRQLQRQRGRWGVQVSGAHAFGSIIRAYGHLRDLEGAWEAWAQMRSRGVLPTSITIGCMVEALVSNGDPEAGFELVHELSEDDSTRPLLNAVVYCSVLKGFAQQQRFDCVWGVYDEMILAKLQFSIVTYNALIDACARGGEMARVQPLLRDMAREGIEPNLVTYSTIVKGHCQEGRLDKALELLGAMKESRHLRPDEITYNILIDGCAQQGLYDQGMKLLDEMQEAGVPPSNFTLSVVVKLANRGRRPERAFELVEELGRKYRLRPNVHVFDNLVHACTNHGDLRGALQVLERMARQRVRPDARTYRLLLRGCLEAGDFRQAAGLLRLACGVRGAQMPQPLAALASGPEAQLLQLKGGPPAELLSEVLEAMAGRGGEERLAVQLCKELRSAPGVPLDPKLAMSLASRALRA